VHPAEKDAFDLWEVWATKDHATDFRTIPAKIHSAVMMLTPEYSKDRAHQWDGAHTNESITSGRGCGPTWGQKAEGGGLRAARRNRPPSL
jgi:hypothetical protein